MKIVAISDTHNKLDKIYDRLNPADLLIIAGDFTFYGKKDELEKFNKHLEPLKERYKHGIFAIPGNHELGVEQDFQAAKNTLTNLKYFVYHEPVVIEGVKFFGSAYTPVFHNWAYNVERGAEMKRLWSQIPEDTDVLITHGPPMNILDRVSSWYGDENVGCSDLLDVVMKMKPKFHIFGHIHQEYGVKDFNGTTFINASTCNEKYMPTNKPIEFEV